MQVTPANMYETMRAGPAVLFAASPVATKMPAPMTAPMPRAVSVTGPRMRRKRCSPAISSSRTWSDFFAKSWFNGASLFVPRRRVRDFPRKRSRNAGTGQSYSARDTVAKPQASFDANDRERGFPWRRVEARLRFRDSILSSLAVHDQRHRPVIDQLDLHVRAESSARRRHAQGLHRLQKRLVQGNRHRRRRRVHETRPAAFAAVAVQRELAHDQDAARN